MSTYYSNYKTQVSKGEASEQAFQSLASKLGYGVRPSETKENKYKHIDCFITKEYSVDVKTVSSYGMTCEFINNWGYNGSLFGEQDLIAYVDKTQTYLVYREDLIRLLASKGVLEIIDNVIYYNEPETVSPADFKYEYVTYNRPDWKDCWLRLNKLDVISIACGIWDN